MFQIWYVRTCGECPSVILSSVMLSEVMDVSPFCFTSYTLCSQVITLFCTHRWIWLWIIHVQSKWERENACCICVLHVTKPHTTFHTEKYLLSQSLSQGTEHSLLTIVASYQGPISCSLKLICSLPTVKLLRMNLVVHGSDAVCFFYHVLNTPENRTPKRIIYLKL